LAEKADAYQPTVIHFGAMDVDDVGQVTVLTGGVKLSRGSLSMSAERALVKQAPDGYQHVTLFGEGRKAAFRQKRDGQGELWMDGEAQRIEYDQRAELVTLLGEAVARRSEGSKRSDEVLGEFIAYDSRRESYRVRNTASGEDKPGAGFGTMVMQPLLTAPPAMTEKK
jgi:lipopolysaccharide export system protein LptA